jgi:RNA polymerase sigma-70 factor (family 1)
MPENIQLKRLLNRVAVYEDQAAYKELFVLLHSRLRQFAFSIVKSNEEAEELVSDVFIRIWEKRDQLHIIESPLLYFYTSVRNLAFNRLKKQKRIPSNVGEEWLVQMDSIYFDPERLMVTEEMVAQIRKAINDLPPRCKLIFKLIKEDQLKYKDVAELLQLSVKTIEAQMAIALRRIGKCIQLEIKPSQQTAGTKKS